MRLCDKDIQQLIEQEKIIIKPTPESSMISGVSVDTVMHFSYTLGH